MQGECGSDLVVPKVAEFAESESMPVGHLRCVRLHVPRRHRPFHDPAGRVDVVNNVQRRWILHPGERLHQVEHVLAVVEVPCPRILDLHHHGIQPLKRFLVEHDVVRSRCQFRVPGAEQSLEVPPLREQVVHVSPPRRVPAVLGAEAPDPPVQQCPIQLILKRRSPE